MREAKPGTTARKVALNIITLGAVPGMDEVLPTGIVDATATLLVESGAVGATAVRWSRSKRMVSVCRAFDWMMPGQFETFANRKAFCERQVGEGIRAGAGQVLVLGAGHDTMGWRLAPEYSGVRFLEIDHPATARLKAKGIDAMGRRANLYLIPEDLGKRQLVDVVHASEVWDSAAPTVIVAEGLLMYLPPRRSGRCSISAPLSPAPVVGGLSPISTPVRTVGLMPALGQGWPCGSSRPVASPGSGALAPKNSVPS